VNGWLGFGFSATWGAPLRSQTPAAASVSSAEPARPMRVGDLVKKKTGKSAAPGRVVTFFDRDGVTHAVVEWSPSSESTSERLDQLELL
jgi:hypothetical protein